MLNTKQQINSTYVENTRRFRWFALLSIAAGSGIFVWVIINLVTGNQAGQIDESLSFYLSLAAAIILFGGLLLGSNIRFASLFLLSSLGQASALQLIDAGKNMHYQHYILRGMVQEQPIPVILIVIQTVIVGLAAWQSRASILKWLRSNFKVWQLVLGVILLSMFSATVSPDVKVFIQELLFAAFIQGINLVNMILIALVLPKDLISRIKNIFIKVFGLHTDTDGNSLQKVDRFAILIASWTFLIAAFLSLFSYQRHPHIPDEVAYIYHARYLADGKLVMPAPPVEEAFEIYLMQFDGDRWYPSPPIGWPMVLAVGEIFGLAWLVNPVLGGLNVILIYLLLSHLYSYRLARISILVLAVSPWYVFMAMNFMTHMFTLTCALVSALGLVWVRETGKARWIVLAGIALGVMSLIRPLEALIWSMLLGIWAIGIGGKRLKLVWLAAFVITTGLTASLVLPYNKHLTGSAALFPINLHTDQRFGQNSNAYGFGPDRGMGWPIDPNLGHGPFDAMINADLNGFSMNIELFGWSTGSFLFAILFFISGSYRRSDYLMMGVILAVFAAFFFYYFSGGPDFGARYWFLMIVPLFALSVRGIQYLEGKLDGMHPGTSARVLPIVFLLGVMALVNYFPWRAIDKYYHYLNMRPDIRELANEYNFGRSLVLISGEEHPDYASAFVYNPIDMQAAAPIYAWDRNPEVRRKVLEAYNDRPVWIVAGPTITQAGYQVLEGPLSASDLLATSESEMTGLVK